MTDERKGQICLLFLFTKITNCDNISANLHPIIVLSQIKRANIEETRISQIPSPNGGEGDGDMSNSKFPC